MRTTNKLAVKSIISHFSGIMQKMDLQKMSAEDFSSVKQKLSDVKLEIDVLSQFTPDNDPVMLNIKKIDDGLNNIFTKLNRYDAYL